MTVFACFFSDEVPVRQLVHSWDITRNRYTGLDKSNLYSNFSFKQTWKGMFVLSQTQIIASSKGALRWARDIIHIFFFVFSFVFLSVFSATSVDYSSFADRCNSWIELIKLKAQTIRRGSIKTSRRLFLPRYDNLRHISDFPVVNRGVPCPAIVLQITCRMTTWVWKLPTLLSL